MRRAWLVALALALCCAAAADTRADTHGATVDAEQRPATTALDELEAAVFARVNAHREALGLPAFAASDLIAQVARRHSEDMAAGRVPFGHEGFAERMSDLSERLSPSRLRIARLAENVSKHERRYAGGAEAAVAGWLASPPHRENIDGNATLSGVGAARDTAGTYYLTQLFVLLQPEQ